MRIRNKRPGPLVIADAKLRLRPGEVARVAAVTPQMQGALRRGLLEEVPENTPLGAPEAPKPAPAPPAEYDRLSVAETIEQVGEETDPKKLEVLLQTEKRKTVIEALKRRLQEVRPGGTQ
ncbi:MAG TPA: hypothetical protein P5532_24660 [Planctomycetota bacterium]|nr:hypothetical protein [Planctomycetota bacterium]HRT97612.1 hypothetical protein [Planctomycetota bacterium]